MRLEWKLKAATMSLKNLNLEIQPLRIATPWNIRYCNDEMVLINLSKI